MSKSTGPAPEQRIQPFPGGDVVPAEGELRIAIDKRPYAEVIGHAVLEPEVEVCGVLVGRLERDDRGQYLHVTHTIRGEAAKQRGAQVTFTHDTWNHIHQEMDRQYADRQIVGWYHTHGGFGIFLSDMDQFIHKNFFTEPHHVAYVFDPLAGTEGFFHHRDGQFKEARRYWLGGRERRSLSPPAAQVAEAGSGDLAAAVQAMQRAAAALQTVALSRQGDGLPSWGWIAGTVLALLVVYAFLSGEPFGRGGPAAHGSSPMLILERDEASGRAVGLELVVLEQQEGPVYRDRAGQPHVGVEAVGPDGKPSLALKALLGGASSEAAPPMAPPVAAPRPPTPARSAPPFAVIAGIAGVVALAMGGVLLWLWRARPRGRGAPRKA